jgi:hypothetical protein
VLAVQITDELRLLIKAEAAQAIKETREYKNSVDGADVAQKKMAGSAKQVAKQMLGSVAAYASAGAAIAAVTRYVREASDAYTQAQGDVRKFEITYSDVLKEAEEVTREWADTFDYAQSTAKQVLGSAGDIYTGMGLTSSAALELADQTAYLGGALSKLNPQLGSAAEATQALITATTGEREAMKRWGVIIQETAVQQKLLERGQEDLTGSALLAAKAQAVLDIAYEQSPNALNAVASTTQLAADTNRYLAETWKEHLELSGRVINNGLQPMKQALADYLAARNEVTRAEIEAARVGIDSERIEAYEKTAKKVEDLIERYEDLQSKSKLSTAEQKELKKVIADISRITPNAARGFDEYGNAIDISTEKAQAFADKQREWAISERELQLMRLEYQEKQTRGTVDQAKKRRTEIAEELADMQSVNTARKNVARVAKEAQELLYGGDVFGARELLRQNQDVFDALVAAGEEAGVKLRDGLIDPEAFDRPGDTGWQYLDAELNSAISAAGDIEKLENEYEELGIVVKEQEGVLLEIEMLNTELDYLAGNTESLIAKLEEQVLAIPGVSAEYYKLRKQYSQGAMDVDTYRAALEDLIASSEEAPQGPDTSSLDKWDAFVQKITGFDEFDKAASYEVELSPIATRGKMPQLEAQLDYYKDLIDDLWAGKDEFGDLDEWQDALEAVVGRYGEVQSQVDEIASKRKRLAAADDARAAALKDQKEKRAQQEESAQEAVNSLLSNREQLWAHIADYREDIIALEEAGLLTADQRQALVDNEIAAQKEQLGITAEEQRARELIISLMDEQEAKQLELTNYEAELRDLGDKGLLTERQINELLKERKELLEGEVEESLSWDEELEKNLDQIKDKYFTLESASQLMSETFSDIGAAMASGDLSFETATKALQDYTSSILSEVSTVAMLAGLRAIAEGGLAALPLALGLWALGGVAGISAGFLGSSGKGVDASIKDSLSDELEIRQTLNETLNESLDVEMSLLRRQLDRNLISEEEYREQALSIGRERNQGEAQEQALGLIDEAIGEIDSELSDMSGWSKFWSGKDERLEGEADELEALARRLNAAETTEEIKELIQELEGYGIDIDKLPSFATGGSFVTNGPQPILVGDNPSGRELVNITPLDSGRSHGSTSGQTVININGPVYGWEEMRRKLEAVGYKVERRGGGAA